MHMGPHAVTIPYRPVSTLGLRPNQWSVVMVQQSGQVTEIAAHDAARPHRELAPADRPNADQPSQGDTSTVTRARRRQRLGGRFGRGPKATAATATPEGAPSVAAAGPELDLAPNDPL